MTNCVVTNVSIFEATVKVSRQFVGGSFKGSLGGVVLGRRWGSVEGGSISLKNNNVSK